MIRADMVAIPTNIRIGLSKKEMSTVNIPKSTIAEVKDAAVNLSGSL